MQGAESCSRALRKCTWPLMWMRYILDKGGQPHAYQHKTTAVCPELVNMKSESSRIKPVDECEVQPSSLHITEQVNTVDYCKCVGQSSLKSRH